MEVQSAQNSRFKISILKVRAFFHTNFLNIFFVFLEIFRIEI